MSNATLVDNNQVPVGTSGNPLYTTGDSTLPTGAATAANQTSQITQETAINTVLGLQADAAYASGSGTISAKLRTIAAIFALAVDGLIVKGLGTGGTLPILGRSFTPTEASTLSITTGGTSQQVFAANASRKFFSFTNNSDTVMYVRFSSTAASATAGHYVAANGGSIYLDGCAAPASQINVFCITTGKTFYAVEG